MSGIIGFCGAVLCIACLGLVIKQLRPDFFPVFAACGGVVCAGYTLYLLLPVGGLVAELTGKTAFPPYFGLLFKAVGISLLCTVAADICRDMGENGLANGVEGAGRAAILLLSLPVVRYLLESAASLAS
ncbi:MAG: stage III sporulation AC/AD family protein [Clostridia bacterium]|nr:stage III sporulation AC/AD family protein [Clostridia bacterium]